MFCPFCGTRLTEIAAYCTGCGKRVPEQRDLESNKRAELEEFRARQSEEQAQDERTDGVVLGRDVETGELVTLGKKERETGVYMIGLQRMGKTSLLLNMMLHDAKGGHGFCYLDPHGDAVFHLLARLPDDRVKDVVLLDASDEEHPFGINFYEVSAQWSRGKLALQAEGTVDIFKKLFTEGEWAAWGARLEILLRMIAYYYSDSYAFLRDW